jgi:hypothetical protein
MGEEQVASLALDPGVVLRYPGLIQFSSLNIKFWVKVDPWMV